VTPPVLEVSVTIDAATITAFFVGIVACFSAYGALQQRQAAVRVAEVAKDAAETRKVIDDTHTIVNSQRTAMEVLIKKLEGENAELRAGGDPAEGAP
jgi:uncharacterized membrane protein YgcG